MGESISPPSFPPSPRKMEGVRLVEAAKSGDVRFRGPSQRQPPQPYHGNPPVEGVLTRDDGRPSAPWNICYGIFVIIITIVILGFCVWILWWSFIGRDAHDVIKVCLDAIKVCLDLVKDCVLFIKLHIMIPDNDCDDGDPCTVDLSQDGGCSHKYVKPTTQTTCIEICHDENGGKKAAPTLNGKAPLKGEFGASAPRIMTHNGVCVTGGVCEASTRCKGECTPSRKRDAPAPKTGSQEHAASSEDEENPKVPGSANRLELMNQGDSRNHLLVCEAQGCPFIAFKPPFDEGGFLCTCLGCGVCMWRLEIDLGFQTQGFVDSHCKNTRLLEKKCLDLVEHDFPEKECLVPAIRFCDKFQGKFVVECSLHFACAKATVINKFNP